MCVAMGFHGCTCKAGICILQDSRPAAGETAPVVQAAVGCMHHNSEPMARFQGRVAIKLTAHGAAQTYAKLLSQMSC